MGRMMDILRTADRRPAAHALDAEPSGGKKESDENELESVVPSESNLHTAEPPLEDDDDVPFIEVGGKREPTLRLVPAPAATLTIAGVEKDQTPRLPSLKGKGEEVVGTSPPFPLRQARPAGPESSTPALLTIRFQPVHAARLGSRGPVAELIAFHEPDHAVSVQYRSLAAEIARQLPGSLPRILLFAGAAEAVGTSTVLLNLAVTLARQDANVTVVDANLARPGLAKRLGLPAGPGLREVLAGQMPPAWCLQETAQPNLLALPAGTSGQPRDSAELTAILEMLRERSDCVLLDAGSWTDGKMASDLAVGSDAVYLVLKQEAAESGPLQEEVLQQTGRLRGCVLTSLPIP
jgi:Mrp family chromosome partitioning ATPase